MAAAGAKSKAKPAPAGENKVDQSQRFVEAARELGADQSEEEFDEALKRIGRAPVRKGGKAKAPRSEKGQGRAAAPSRRAGSTARTDRFASYAITKEMPPR